MAPNVVLASGSPRRTMLLSAAGIPHRAVAPDVDESVLAGESPAAYVLRLSGTKASAVATTDDDVVIGADTTVVLGNEVIGKPADRADAVSILHRLQGSTHEVLTGWTVRRGSQERFGVAESVVRFNARSPAELADYIDRTQPYDKAGAYALQSDDGWLVAGVTGSRSNVMGLPVSDIIEALADFGIERSAPHRS